MQKMNQNADDNIIDFEFFESHREKLKPFGNETKYSSKIITKAVIEPKPKEIQTNSLSRPSNLNNNIRLNNENTVLRMTYDCDSSPTSSEEKKLLSNEMDDIALFNCLAFNDDVDDRQMFVVTDDKYMSDNSLSDSTITTVSSDFTSVSRLSSVPDSSCGSDLSSDSTSPKIAESKCSDNLVMCNDNNTGDINIELSKILPEEVDESNDGCESTMYKTNTNSESVTPEYDYKCSTNDYSNDNTNPDKLINESDEDGKSRDYGKINEDNNYQDVYEENVSLENKERYQCHYVSRKGSSSTEDLEEKLGNISLASQLSSSNSSMAKTHNYWRGQNRFRSKRKEFNLTFSREELIRIERDNTILLKKIMSYSKPRSVLLNHAFSHKKTSAAINRARQQKKIEQDNYILYSKINAMNRMKKVF